MSRTQRSDSPGIEIFETNYGFNVRFVNEKFKLPDTITTNNRKDQMISLQNQIDVINSILSGFREYFKEERPGRNSNPSRLRDRQT